jgi:ribosome recycling factor
MVKRGHDLAETTRNSIRQARREGNDRLKVMEREKEIGQDEEHRGLDEMQKLHDHYIGETNKSLEHKEKDILTV